MNYTKARELLGCQESVPYQGVSLHVGWTPEYCQMRLGQNAVIEFTEDTTTLYASPSEQQIPEMLERVNAHFPAEFIKDDSGAWLWRMKPTEMWTLFTGYLAVVV